MERIYRKTFNVTINFSAELCFVFRYQQASLRDLLEFNEYIKASLINDWLWTFLNEHCTQTVEHNPRKLRWFAKKRTARMTAEEFRILPPTTLNNVIDFILKTYARGFFKKVDGEKAEKTGNAPIESMFVTIFQETNETLETVLSMTWEQFMFIQDGLIYNLNERTEKGRRKNKMNDRLKEMREEMSDEEALAAVKRMEQKMKERREKEKLNNPKSS